MSQLVMACSGVAGPTLKSGRKSTYNHPGGAGNDQISNRRRVFPPAKRFEFAT